MACVAQLFYFGIVGLGGGFQFKYKRHMLELCLMYVAAKTLRDAMSTEEKITRLRQNIESNSGHLELLQSLKGYIHTIDTRIQEGSTSTCNKSNRRL